MSSVASSLAGNGPVSRLAYRICRFVVTWTVRLFTRMRIEGRENVPTTGPFVLAPVHRSYIDTPIAACVTTRRLRFMGKDAVWKHRTVGWMASALGAFPVTRGSADREALSRGVAVLEAGEPLVLFPEGERKSGPVVQPLFDGAVYIAVKAGVPIVPVGIGGSERVWPKGARVPRPRRVHVVVGRPIEAPVPPDGRRLPRSAVREHSARLHEELQGLFDEAERRVGR